MTWYMVTRLFANTVYQWAHQCYLSCCHVNKQLCFLGEIHPSLFLTRRVWKACSELKDGCYLSFVVCPVTTLSIRGRAKWTLRVCQTSCRLFPNTFETCPCSEKNNRACPARIRLGANYKSPWGPTGVTVTVGPGEGREVRGVELSPPPRRRPALLFVPIAVFTRLCTKKLVEMRQGKLDPKQMLWVIPVFSL